MEKRKRGHPTLYRPEYADQAMKLCLLLGATDKNLAEYFDVDVDSIYEWKKVHPEFSDALRAGKHVADANVAHSLYSRAVGARHVIHQAIKVRKTKYDDKGKKVSENEEIVTVPVEYEEAPETNACSLWLRNRSPKHWRDKVDVDVTGNLSLADALSKARERVKEPNKADKVGH